MYWNIAYEGKEQKKKFPCTSCNAQLTNNDLEKCYQAIMSIIDCEKKGRKFLFDQNKIKEKISKLIS